MIPSLEGWPPKAKEAPSPHEVILRPLDTNPVFQCLKEKRLISQKKASWVEQNISITLVGLINKIYTTLNFMFLHSSGAHMPYFL